MTQPAIPPAGGLALFGGVVAMVGLAEADTPSTPPPTPARDVKSAKE